jgi:anhydro-N-acetylmuramic acid kinase
MLVTGGGAFNEFLMERIAAHLEVMSIKPVVPSAELVQYKEALIMAFIGVLRWRQENTVLSSVTGASVPSIGGAFWMGQEA